MYRMMLRKKTTGYYFRYPLMAVMLLWALTLPGQEVAVYSLLFHGTASGLAFQPATSAGEGQAAVQEQAVQAFQDARVSSCPEIGLAQPIKQPLLLLAFAAPTNEPIPAFATGAAGVRLLAQLLPATLQPNAP